MTLYQFKHGVELRNSWDWKSLKPATLIEKLNIDDTVSLASWMHQVWRTIEENIKKAQESIIKRINKYRRSIDWKPGDRVYLSTRNLKSYCLNHKLSSKFDRPYYIVERIGFGY